jgi:superfamily II DNA or RNA helicase
MSRLVNHSDALCNQVKYIRSHGSKVGARYEVSAIDDAQMTQVKKELTLTPKFRGAVDKDKDDSFEVYSISEMENAVEVPRYYGLLKWGLPVDNDGVVQDQRTTGVPWLQGNQFRGALRDTPPQRLIVDSAVKILQSPLGGCILQLGCGQGKTVCALAIAGRLGRRTAILVNNGKTLLPQWVDRIAQFYPGAKVGVVRSAKNDLKDPSVDIVVCVIQSLSKRTYDQDMLDTVGTVIVDECHHVGARVFALCMRQFRARYTLGLTATPDRKDGLRKYVEYLLGPVAISCPTDFSRVKVLRYIYKDARINAHATAKDHLQRCLMVNDATRDFERTLFLLKVVLNIVKESPRCILVLTERVQQVDDFAKWFAQSGCTEPVARLHAGVPREQVLDAASARVVVANYPMASEALDIPHLDTMVGLTPMVGFIEQVVGRIVRIADDKRVPLVVDVVDNIGLFAGMARTRSKWYKAQVDEVRDNVVTNTASATSNITYDAVKPSCVITDWLTEPDPWNK